MTLRKATILASIFLSSTTFAEPPVWVHGFEDESCGAWAESARDPVVRAQYLYWFRGFVSGHNAAIPNQQIGLDRMPSQETLVLYIDRYCRDNPLGIFTGAAFSLINELQ